MNAGILLFVVSDVKDYLVAKQLLSTDGVFVAPSVTQDVELVGVVEKSLADHGVTIPSEVEKVLVVLPLVLSLAGVK